MASQFCRFYGGTATVSQGENLIALLCEALLAHGIKIEPDWSGDIIRDGPQWFVGKKWDFEGETYYRCWFGDYKHDIKQEWKSYSKLNKTQQAAADNQSNDLNEKEREAREKIQVEAAVQCQREFNTFRSEGDTPYMRRKQIAALYGSRIKPNENGDPILAVPLRDIDGLLWNFQRIYAQKLSKGDKFFADGARIEGLFHVLDWSQEKTPTPGRPVYICEGFATAASVYEALRSKADTESGAPFVVAAFNAGNLQSVSQAFREKHPLSPITICADNDAYTTIKKGDSQHPYNVGIEKARRAAGSVGGEVVYPVFKYPAKGLTDFNDLHCAQGLDLVADQILNFHKYVTGIQPLNIQVSKSGKPQDPTEEQVCAHLLKFFGDHVIRQDKSLFIYKQNHWVELGPTGLDDIKIMIGIAANKMLGSRDIEAYFRYFYTHCPRVPVGIDLFQPNPFAANFQNGTLHSWQEKDRKFKTEFRKHEPKDFLTSVLPFDCPAWRPGEVLPPAPMFDAMIERLWSKNSDRDEVRLLAYELIGAALMPLFPIIIIFHGKPNSGKSTFIKLLVRLVSRANVCSVQLCDMQGFNMESMIGKLVNFDTDIDVNRPMNDSEVKKLIDRVPRRIRRKGIADVYAHLPAVHLFAANRPPKSLDGSSHAYGRRMILVHTDSPVGDAPEQNFEVRLLDSELDGILARGIQGLFRLLDSGGYYTIPASSADQVSKLELDSDLIGQFIDDIKDGEVRTEKAHKLVLTETGHLERPILWDCFRAWQEISVTRNQHLGKHQFFERFEARGFELFRDKNGRYFKGVTLSINQDPIA